MVFFVPCDFLMVEGKVGEGRKEGEREKHCGRKGGRPDKVEGGYMECGRQQVKEERLNKIIGNVDQWRRKRRIRKRNREKIKDDDYKEEEEEKKGENGEERQRGRKEEEEEGKIGKEQTGED